MSNPTVTLVTGTERGIGHGMLVTLLSRPNNVIIASVRNPNTTTAQALNVLEKANGTTLHIVKIDSTIPSDATEAVNTLKAKGIASIDTIIASAAIGDTASSVLETPLDAVTRQLNINVVAVLGLFQAFEPLLREAKSGNPRFITLSSPLGSIELAPVVPGPWFCYGITKAALNYMVRRMHVENEWLTAVALSPGWVQTDMGNFAAQSVGMENAPKKLEETLPGCFEIIDGASRQKYAGEFIDYEKSKIPW